MEPTPSTSIEETPTELILEISPLPKIKPAGTKRKLHATELTGSANITLLKSRKLPQRTVKKHVSLPEPNPEPQEDFSCGEDDDDEFCIFCAEPYKLSKKGEKWIQCSQCKKWSHTLCADVGPKVKSYTCDLCVPDI
ncbi:hypothetical protein PPYR_01236 [Photinus pyralis]|uniref:Zinc finger PHD-type domain-containing protein n=1 Tax=Photinus pyralis TaxID=7054 RepID=A0A1Y1MQ47_PHOPY|nr:hypothetical protein PPYR_01236 [Photinus pyralis]